ncbi:hypothetical protein T4B_6971 [Trichinella pseudospiralis]|uniref:Uncharacterized protein n=1 Tax=Trichinella pseudospiralis TaxID=6337 RepID=A0A0V1EWU8_TRIPS|nr:hypothetical protein T4A_5545 [Trichinella pseudospiralis]KRZ28639.1 hypothetical protein T4B_6971 [Trichinella pseudospiralis]KRZ44290.1 hypothetical protein T4C_12944 [Trichinella pseudospiralis]
MQRASSETNIYKKGIKIKYAKILIRLFFTASVASELHIFRKEACHATICLTLHFLIPLSHCNDDAKI